MNVEIIAFGIAKDIVKGKSVQLALEKDATVAEAKRQLLVDFPDFAKLASLQLAVNAEYVSDDHILEENDEVVLIPPVSGG